MISTQYIKLTMAPAGVMPALHCSQYDVGRQLGVIVYDSAGAVDMDELTVTVEATRRDGTAITVAVTTDGNVGTFETTATMTNEAGFCRAQLVLTNGDGDRIASLPFMILVVDAAMDENAESIEEDASLYQQYNTAMQALLSTEASTRAAADTTLQNNINTEATTRANAVTAEATARQAADNTLQSNINSEASTRASADNTLQSQIDQLVAPSGSAPSAAEVENARIGVDGTTYDTLGNAIRGQVGDLKSAFGDSTGNIIYPFTRGGYITNNGSTVDISTVTSNGAYAYTVIDCAEGDVFTIYGHGASTQRLYAFAGAESGGTRPVLAKATANYTASGDVITAPEGAEKLIVNALVADKYALYRGRLIKTVWSELEDSTEALQTEIGYLRHANADVTTQFSVTTGKYCSAGSASLGNLNTDADCYATDYIKVYPGSVIKASNVYLYGARGICAYRADKTVISALASNSGTLNSVDVAITIPEDAEYIRATGKTANGMCSFEYLSIIIPGADSIRPEYTDVTATATDGKYVSANSGGIPNDTGACASAFIRVRPYAHIIASGLYLTGVRSICAYDKNHDFLRAIISNTSDTTYEFDVDPDVYYIRATGLVGVPPTIKMSVPDVDDTKRLFTDVSILIPYDHRKSVCRKIVTYVDDDALDEAGMDLLKQSCDTLGIKCSIAAIGKILESTPSRVTYLKGLESEGFHICNHSYDHSRWYEDYGGQTMFTLAEVEQDLIKSIRLLDSLGFIDASRFLIYPGSSYNRAGITEVTKKWTELACTISAGNNRIESVPRSWLYRCHIDALTHPDLAYYQSQLTDLTVEDGNNWIIYYSHCKTFDESGEWTQSLFEGVMQNALNNGYTAMTLNEAWQYRKSMWLVQEAFGV